MEEMKKIELRKKERERKQQDLQKLISAAEQNTERYKHSTQFTGTYHTHIACSARKSLIKKTTPSSTKKMRSTGTPGQTKIEGSSIFKSYDKSSGITLRSSKVMYC